MRVVNAQPTLRLVRIPAVPDVHNDDGDRAGINAVDDPIFANAKAQQSQQLASQCFDIKGWRFWVFCQEHELLFDRQSDVAREREKLFLCLLGENEMVPCHAHEPP